MKPFKNSLVVVTLSFIVSIGMTGPVLASDAGGIRAECKNQAIEYDIQSELIAGYIDDCVMALGGEVVTVPAGGALNHEEKEKDDDIDAQSNPEQGFLTGDGAAATVK